MNKRQWLAAAGGAGIVGLLIVLLLQWGPKFSSAETLSEQEARDSVISRYSGEITGIKQERERYIVDLRLDTGLYEIQVHAQTGDVLSLERKEAFPSPGESGVLTREQIESIVRNHQPGDMESLEMVKEGQDHYYKAVIRAGEQWTTVKVDPVSGEILASATTDSDPSPMEPPQLLTAEEAEQRALEHIPGEVDDVDWKQVDGTGFYLVEIELPDGREAVVQIHAITGEVMSVSWDD